MSSDSPAKILIDSHIFIWLLYEPEKISPAAQDHLRAAETVLISAASLWELTLKHTKGKLAYPPDELLMGVDVLNLDTLHILPPHLMAMSKVSLRQSDPFDTMLVAQSQAEGLVLMTADQHILGSAYSTLPANI